MAAQQYKVTRYEGQTRNGNKDMLTKVSTAIVQGRFLTVDSSGYVIAATNSTSSKIIGISMEAKASSDATTTPILIDFLRKGDLLRVTLDAGSSATAATCQALVGTTFDIASTGGVDAGTDTHHDVYAVSMTCFAAARVGDATSDILVALNNSVF